MFERFKQDDLRGVRFALNVFIGTTALWLFLRHFAGVNPIWAIASMIASSVALGTPLVQVELAQLPFVPVHDVVVIAVPSLQFLVFRPICYEHASVTFAMASGLTRASGNET